MEPREDEKREPKVPEPREAEQKPRRFRIVKLEERIAPQAARAISPSEHPALC